jgi:hypothetical protein
MTLARLAPLVLLTLTGCATGKDEVHLNSVAGSDSPTIVLSGRRTQGCVKEDVAHGSPNVAIENLLSSRNCPSEVAAFAKSNAMSLKNTVGKWSDASGDVVDITMRAPYVVPLNIFIMSGGGVSHSLTARQNEATMDVRRASQLYDDAQCGIVFSTGVPMDERRGNFLPDLLNAECRGNVEKFKAVDAQRTALKGINVFYTDGPSGLQGQMCRDAASAVIVITQSSGNETLAHELGHALTLEHTNTAPGMPLADLMMSPSSYPGSLTIGQCFRTNVEPTSVLNSSMFRTEPTRSCANAADCLSLTLQR